MVCFQWCGALSFHFPAGELLKLIAAVSSIDSPLLSSSHQLWSHEDPSEVKGECFATLAQLVLALEAEEFVVRTFQEEHKSDEDRTPVAIGARFSTLIKLAESAGWEKDTTVPGMGKIPFSIATATEKPDLYREWYCIPDMIV